MATDWQELLFNKLDAIHKELSENAQKTAAIESTLHSVIGNGQPGRLGKLEVAVDQLVSWKHQQIGEQRASRRKTIKWSAIYSAIVVFALKIVEHVWWRNH